MRETISKWRLLKRRHRRFVQRRKSKFEENLAIIDVVLTFANRVPTPTITAPAKKKTPVPSKENTLVP